MSLTSSMEKEHTVAPRFGVISTSPSASSIVSACLTGVLPTPSRSASCSSIKRSSGPYSPVRIKARNRSTTPTGRDPLPPSRTTCSTRPPFLTYGESFVYNLRRPRILCQEFQGWNGVYRTPSGGGRARLCSWNRPRTFRTRRDANRWLLRRHGEGRSPQRALRLTNAWSAALGMSTAFDRYVQHPAQRIIRQRPLDPFLVGRRAEH